MFFVYRVNVLFMVVELGIFILMVLEMMKGNGLNWNIYSYLNYGEFLIK